MLVATGQLLFKNAGLNLALFKAQSSLGGNFRKSTKQDPVGITRLPHRIGLTLFDQRDRCS